MSFHSSSASPDAEGDRTLSERAYRLLHGDILAGRLNPGEKLRLQTLQERYQLGISPIREALMYLSNERLVANEGQRGFRVADASREDLVDILHARRHIESILLTESMRNGDDEWGAGIAAAFFRLQRTPLPATPEDEAAIDRFEAVHRQFHQALLGAARSPWLQRIDEQLVAHSERYRRIRLQHMKGVASPYSKQESGDIAAEHEKLMQAVLDKDVPLALQLLNEHISDTARVVGDYLGYDMGDGAAREPEPAPAKPAAGKAAAKTAGRPAKRAGRPAGKA